MYIVAYDITDNKERQKVANIISDFGERIQKSVWVCEIDNEICSRLRARLEELQLTSGNIHIWLSQKKPWKIGNEETMPKETWVHIL